MPATNLPYSGNERFQTPPFRPIQDDSQMINGSRENIMASKYGGVPTFERPTIQPVDPVMYQDKNRTPDFDPRVMSSESFMGVAPPSMERISVQTPPPEIGGVMDERVLRQQALYEKPPVPATTRGSNVEIAPIHRDIDPLQGEMEASRMPDINYSLYAPQGDYGLSGAESALRQGAGAQAGALTEGAHEAFRSMHRGGSQARTDIAGGFGTGLRLSQQGLEQARGDIAGQLSSGLSSLRRGLSTGRRDITDAAQGAISRFDPYESTGQSALQREAALSGALGPEAQAEAFTAYQESPGQQWAREQQEQALLRNQAAVGGLGSGNVLTALQEQAAGIAAQNYQQDLANLRSLAGRGQEAAGAQAGIQTQAGQNLAQMAMQAAQSELGARQAAGAQLGQMGYGAGQAGLGAALQSAQQLANLAQQTGMTQAQLQQGLGRDLSNVYGGTAANVAGLRSAAGQQIAQQLGLSGQQLAQLQSGQGAALAGIDQQTAANIANLAAQQGQQTSGLRTGLAALLANLATGQGSQQANLATQLGGAQAAGVTNPWGNTVSTLTGLLAQNPQLITSLAGQTTP